MKQETLEEVAERQWGNVHRTGVLGFIDGAKWQQERSYSEEEHSYSKKELQEAWEASEMNMRNKFARSSYKGLTFDRWYNEDILDNSMNIIGQNGNDGTHYQQ